MRIKVTLIVGLIATAAALLAVLAHAPLTVASTNGAQVSAQLAVVEHAALYCQPGESLPRETSAIRLSFGATTGPRILLSVLSGKRTITTGTAPPGWYGSAVTVEVKPVARAYRDVSICARFNSLIGRVGVQGEPGVPSAAGARFAHVLAGRIRITYLQPGHTSWLSLLPTVIERLQIGRATSGSWIVVAIVALIVCTIALAWLAMTAELT